MTVNIGCLEIELSKKLNNASLTEEQILLMAKSIKSFKNSVVITVSTVGDLPDPGSVAAGSLYFVESLREFYISSKAQNRWRYILGGGFANPFIFSWGSNNSGQLGDGTVTTRSSPVSVVGGFTDWCAISAGSVHSVAIRANGTMWSWGYNGQGLLGHNTALFLGSRSSPVSVVGGITDWCAIAAGGAHSLALRTDGTMWSWGGNFCGRLGDGTATDRSSPVAVVGGITDWCVISAGADHSLALRTNGTLGSWGRNSSGQLGDNNTFCCPRSSPGPVVGGITDWCAIAAGGYHSLAVRTNGTAWSWGFNGSGRLGDGTATNRASPVSVVGGFSDWCRISAGAAHNLAVRANGTAWSWGFNGSGQLGDGTVTDRNSPVSVVGGITDWCAIAAGRYHNLAIRTNGTAWSWGCNQVGRLGDGTTTNRSSPGSVVGGIADWCQISAGAHSLAIGLSRQ